MYDELELMEMEDFEDFESFEDYEDYEDFEDFGSFEDYEDFEDFEDYEADPFLGSIFKNVSRVARRVPWADVIRTGTRVLSSLEDEQEAFDEMAYMAELTAETESEAEADQFLGAIAGLASSILPMLMKESDYEDYEDFEDYEDYEDYEGDPFFGALLPIAANLLPAAMPLIKKGVKAIGKALRESDPSGQAVKTLPKIAKDATKKLARQAKAGKPITKKKVAKALASSTRKTLANPKKAAAVVKANRKAAKRAMKRANAKGKLTKKALRRKRLLRAR